MMEDNVPQNQDTQRLTVHPAMQTRLAEIKRLGPVPESLSNAELRRKTQELKERLRTGKPALGQS